ARISNGCTQNIEDTLHAAYSRFGGAACERTLWISGNGSSAPATTAVLPAKKSRRPSASAGPWCRNCSGSATTPAGSRPPPPGAPALRQAWWRKVRRLDVHRLVFVDESGANTAMTRTRARAPKGARAVASVPQGGWKIVTMLGALRLRGVAATATIAAATDG